VWLVGTCLVCAFLFVPAQVTAQLVGLSHAQRDEVAEQCRQIGAVFVAYSADNGLNGNAYPNGKSSTEVFQKLLDAGYITDPTIFYFPLPGKTKPSVGKKLKPENVCFDVTSGADSNAPDGLPLVFITGYKVRYAAGAAAVPVAKPFPPTMMVFYKINSSKFIFPDPVPNSDGSIPKFVPEAFKPDGYTYRQLTPDGVLPP
jgi:hypothetical protein